MIPVILELTESRYLIAYPLSWRACLPILARSSFTTLKKKRIKINFTVEKEKLQTLILICFSLSNIKFLHHREEHFYLYALYVCLFVCFKYFIVLLYVIELNHNEGCCWLLARS